ncbi:MAG: aromatic ring-hydroxylating dioxygenase subunit alpha [Candidatus Obscuribacterales bacterium]|nr:aromatic ring-hydroxylating dioxygenase subunit alpha [Candidatus Obscuribacterales bacterium]
MQVPAGWYAICRVEEIPPADVIGLRRFGRDLVLWRDGAGVSVVMEDRCPHRGAKLSGGRVREDRIVCPYHGFEFSGEGRCTLVPETGSSALNLEVSVSESRVAHGFLWLLHGETSAATLPVPWFEDISDDFSVSWFKESWNAHITRCIENQLDYAHLPFVHKSTIGANFNPARGVDFDLQERLIGFKFGSAPKNIIEFRVPNIWINRIADRYKLMLVFVPVDSATTELYLVSFQKFCTLPLIRDVINFASRKLNQVILGQDRQVVISQEPKDSIIAEEKLFPSDKAISHFRQVWRRNL